MSEIAYLIAVQEIEDRVEELTKHIEDDAKRERSRRSLRRIFINLQDLEQENSNEE